MAVPFSISPLPTTFPSTIISTGPFGTGFPVVASVTSTLIVTFPATLSVTLASVTLSRGSTVIGTVTFVELYVSFPG